MVIYCQAFTTGDLAASLMRNGAGPAKPLHQLQREIDDRQHRRDEVKAAYLVPQSRRASAFRIDAGLALRIDF